MLVAPECEHQEIPVKPWVVAKVTVHHVTGFNAPRGPGRGKIVVVVLHSEFLLPQATPPLALTQGTSRHGGRPFQPLMRIYLLMPISK